MADKPWLASYPEGVPATVDPDRYRSLADLCRSACALGGGRVAFSNLGTNLSFEDFDRLSRDFAAYLTVELKLKAGDRVAVMLPNLLQSPVVIYGILRAGLVVVNVNPLYTAPELEHQLSDSGARAIVVLENFAATVAKVLTQSPLEAVIVTTLGDAHSMPKRVVTEFVVRYVKRLVPPWHIPTARKFRAVLHRGSRLEYRDPDVTAEDTAFLQYTGGTTGVAKGAMLSHRNMVSNVLQAVAWVRPFFSADTDVAMTPLPLYHIFALTVNMFAFIELGSRNVLVTNPRDLKRLSRELSRERVVFLTGVNTLFNGLVHSPGFDDHDFGSLRISLAGGMAVQADVASNWERATGSVIAQGYGLTETSPVVSANPLNLNTFNGSVGLPFPSTDVAILNESGEALPMGEIGEIGVKGPQVMQGYWQRPEETAATFTSDGWLKTGDLGRIDEQGFLYIEDRKKDVINVSGFNVYPNEIENVVTSHPGVLEAAAIGVASERSGEAVKVFVVKKDAALTEEILMSFCRERLTGYKTPDIVEFVTDLPKSNVGKVLRRELKDREEGAVAKADGE